MVFIKPKDILQNFFYIVVLTFSTLLMAFNIYKSDFSTLWNRICNLSVKMSLPSFSQEKICNSAPTKEEENNIDDNELDIDDDSNNYTNNSPAQETFKEQKNSNIIETQMGQKGLKCGNFYVKNKTGKEINFDNYLSKTPKIKIKNRNSPIVLIYHTHTSEGYSGCSRTQDNTKNVVSVGDEIVKTLESKGIKSIHDISVHDFPKYDGAYNRSAETVKKNIKKKSDIQILIDIHRDSMGDNITGRIKPTFKSKNGKKAAQIMFVSGCGINKSLNFPNWEKNLILALNLQSVCERCFPGLTREFLIKNSKYNQNLNPGSILIEIGSDANSLDEAKIAARMLGESLAIFLKRFIK